MWKVKQEEIDNQTVIEKQCKFFQYGHACLSELTYGYCKYLHDDLLRNAINITLNERGTPEELCKMLDISDDDYVAYKAAIRYAPKPDSITLEELAQIQFML